MTRIYKDYIEACVEATNKSPIPKLFRRWAALSSVSGALGRRVWMPMANYDIRSNIFVVLVAGPGRNKSVSLILPFSKVFRKLTTPVGTTPDHDHFNSGLIEYGLKEFPLYLIQDRITPEKLAVDMSKASRFDMRLSTIGDEFYDGSLTLVTSELGTFLSRHERYLQMFLTDMWDSKMEYSHKTKTAGEYIIKGPCLNWLACATPEQFVDNLPEDAEMAEMRKLAGLEVSEGAPIEFEDQVSVKDVNFAEPSKSSSKLSIANRFPEGSDVNDIEVKKEMYVKELQQLVDSIEIDSMSRDEVFYDSGQGTTQRRKSFYDL